MPRDPRITKLKFGKDIMNRLLPTGNSILDESRKHGGREGLGAGADVKRRGRRYVAVGTAEPGCSDVRVAAQHERNAHAHGASRQQCRGCRFGDAWELRCGGHASSGAAAASTMKRPNHSAESAGRATPSISMTLVVRIKTLPSVRSVISAKVLRMRIFAPIFTG